MTKITLWSAGCTLVILLALLAAALPGPVLAQPPLPGAPVQTRVLDDFEGQIGTTQDQFGNSIGFAPWGDTIDNVLLATVATAPGDDLALPGQTGPNQVLSLSFDISSWGGFTHALTDGVAWTSQDWSTFDALSFWLYGSGSGGVVQVEIHENRAPDSVGDSAERWFARITDDFTGWQQFTLPFESFQRRTDWQPSLAPDDGLSLTEVHGYSFGLPAGAGVLYLDQVTLVGGSGALLIEAFEGGGVPANIVTWGETAGNVQLAAEIVAAEDAMALPGQSAPNGVLSVSFDIEGWGGLTMDYGMLDGQPRDLSAYSDLTFWFYGANTGEQVRVEIFDNRSPSVSGDTAERYFALFADDFSGWRWISLPIGDFQRRTDWQPTGAPDDGFGRTEVWGIAFSFPAGVGAQRVAIDDLSVLGGNPGAAEVPVVVLPPTPTPTPAVTATPHPDYPWNGDWVLLWEDNFDAPAGTPIDSVSWTCQTGGDGWGNQEWQYYTSRVENVAHNGEGQLVITAQEETLPGSTCWYGECRYTSARCLTQGKVEFTYGKVEARLKIPFGQGLWPAFWMMGATGPTIHWPNNGEIDIMENIGREPRITHGTVHGPDYSGAQGPSGAFSFETDVSQEFHVFAIEWEPEIIRWTVDGELFYTFTLADLRGQQWVFDHDFYLLMNVAVGGQWPGYPDDTTTFPQTMLVDWVRVYQRQAN